MMHRRSTTASPGTLQLVFTSDSALLRRDVLAKKAPAVPEQALKKLAASLDVAVVAPPRPELAGWSWDGRSLELSWRHGWPGGTCVLESFDIDAETIAQAKLTSSYFATSPEAPFEGEPEPAAAAAIAAASTTTASRSGLSHEPIRSARFSISVPPRLALRLELLLYPNVGHTIEEKSAQQLSAWLVPQECQADLQELAAGPAGRDRHFWPGPLATLVTDGASL